ncbi:MAG: glycosyltransferase family 4 protein [Caulobacteraceae bacterium]|nr:glycosyltransferase family 4 protein [Caulobacteraceae bacterium]
MAKGAILFVRNGEFSNTNQYILAQLRKNFPGADVIDVDLAADTLKYPPFFVLNTILSILRYGVKAVLFERRRYFYFIRTPYFFRSAARRALARARGAGRGIDVVVQTQGVFNAAMSGAPLVIYTDYTMKSPSFGGTAVDPAVLAEEQALFTRANAIAVSANHVRDILISDYGCAPDKVSTVYIGSNALGSDADIPPSRFASRRICFVGIDWVRKGGEELVAGFLKLLERMPDARLIIAGASPAITHPNIEVLGMTPRDQVAELYRTSAVFCLPSRVEPSSVACVEAATMGLPIVATRVGGFVDSVLDGVSGLLVPPRDPDAIAEALYAVLSDPAQAERMGAAGRENAKARFAWDRVGEKLAAVIRARAPNL